MDNFLAHNDKTRAAMLKEINCTTVDDLFRQIPNVIKDFKLADPLSELETQKEIKKLANKNKTDYISFLGAGVYNKFIPAAVSYVAERFEFLTAYTPYQPEISQGTLQIIYEFQSMICRLTGMDIANASMYDVSTAAAEAILMSMRITKKHKALVSNNINPQYKEVIKTYLWAGNFEAEWFDVLPENISDYSAVVYQNPDFYGELHEFQSLNNNGNNPLIIVIQDLAALSVIEPPRAADIVVGDVQPAGIPVWFGGPHAGYMACKEKYLRQLPGRIVGRTVDADGNQAFTLTIQTREQHIKREKATSNICSNQSLIALMATLYLSLMGENGFKQAGLLSAKRAHLLSEELSKKGIKTLNKDFYDEFVIEVTDADETLKRLKNNGIIGGLKLSNTKILVCATEMISESDIDLYISSL